MQEAEERTTNSRLKCGLGQSYQNKMGQWVENKTRGRQSWYTILKLEVN